MRFLLLAFTCFLHIHFVVCQGLGASCSEDAECSNVLKDAVCVNGSCGCEDGYTEAEALKECLPFATFEENVCEATEQCSQMKDSSASKVLFWEDHVPNCDPENNTCVCHEKNWYINEKGKCVRGLYASCHPWTSDCAVEHSSCTWSMECECDFGYKELNNKCVEHECDNSSECVEHSTCTNYKCVCDEDYVDHRDWKHNLVCLPYATPDSLECQEDVQCSQIEDVDGSVASCARSSVCVCADSSMFIKERENGTFFCTRDFDSPCTDDTECQEGLLDAVCVNGKCGCSENYAKVEELRACLIYATHDKNVCQASAQCERMKDSSASVVQKKVPTCDVKKKECVCHADHWYISEENACVRGLHASCTPLVSDCAVQHSSCSLSRTCECDSGYVEDGNTCKVKHECQVSSECSDNAECVDFKCKCNEGYVEHKQWMKKRVCLPYAAPENEYECSYDEQCGRIDDPSAGESKAATCSGMVAAKCLCENNGWFIKQIKNGYGKCVRGFEMECTKDEECQEGISNSVCKNSQCQCEDEFATIKEERLCVPYASEKNNACKYEEQCEKIEDKSGGQGLKRHATCDDDIEECVCRDEHWFIQDGACAAGLEAACGPLTHCAVDHSYCSSPLHGTCVCRHGYESHSVEGECTRVNDTESLGEECNNNNDCTVEHSECLLDEDLERHCQCTHEYVQLQQQCVPRGNGANGYQCDIQDQCDHIPDIVNKDKPKATCDVKEHKCQCSIKEWFIYQDTSAPICSPKLNADCGPHEPCYILNSRCSKLTKTCECIEGFREEEGGMHCVYNAASSTSSGVMFSLVLSLMLFIMQRSSQ